MKRLNIVTCPLCGETDLKGVAVCTDHYATGEKFTLCRCADCGFVFTQGAPDESVIGRYYDVPEYISHSDTEKGLMNKAYHRVRNLMLERKARLVEKAAACNGSAGTLLDIGCGTGYFAGFMQQRGWQTDTVEKSEQARAFAHEHFSLNPLPPEELGTLPSGRYNVITMWHVMEHVQHLRQEWQELGRLLAPGGRLIIAVPNCESADAAHYGPRWAAYDVPRHLWHFTAGTMTRLAGQEGFVLEDLRPMPFDAFYVSMLSEKYSGHARTSFPRGLLRGGLCWLSALGNRRKSSSLIYVFRKKTPTPQTNNE